MTWSSRGARDRGAREGQRVDRSRGLESMHVERARKESSGVGSVGEGLHAEEGSRERCSTMGERDPWGGSSPDVRKKGEKGGARRGE